MKKYLMRYITALLIFGSNGVVASHIALSSAEIVWSRTILGSLVLGLVLVLRRQRPNVAEMRRQWKALLTSGVSMGLSWIFLFEAYRSASVSTATLAYYCGPVLVLALSPLLFRERLTWVKLAGMGAVAVGMVCVNGTELLEEGMTLGLASGLLSALLYASMILSNKRVQGVDGLELTLAQLLISCVVVGPYALLTHSGSGALTGESVFAICFLGVVNSGLACFLYFSSMNRLPAQQVAIFSYLDPLSALLFSAAFLGERLGRLQLLGAALILGGAAFAELMPGGKKTVEEENRKKALDASLLS